MAFLGCECEGWVELRMLAVTEWESERSSEAGDCGSGDVQKVGL